MSKTNDFARATRAVSDYQRQPVINRQVLIALQARVARFAPQVAA